MDLDMKLKFNFNKRNKYKNICSIEGCNNSACGKYCNKHYHQHEMTRSSSVNKTTMKNILNNGRDISIAKFVENTSLIIKIAKLYSPWRMMCIPSSTGSQHY